LRGFAFALDFAVARGFATVLAFGFAAALAFGFAAAFGLTAALTLGFVAAFAFAAALAFGLVAVFAVAFGLAAAFGFAAFGLRLAPSRALAAMLLSVLLDLGLFRTFEAFFATRLLVGTVHPPVEVGA
jgi:hypothetical protein